MADWKYDAVRDLNEYEAVKESLHSIPERIKIAEMEMEDIRSVTFDKTPVDGGMSGREYKLINNIALRGRLEENLDVAQRKVARIERGLKLLTPNERLVLERFYIRRCTGYLDRLCNELGYEKSQVYRIVQEALRKFTLAMFGVADL